MCRFDRESISKMFSGLVPHASELPHVWGNIDDAFYTKVFGIKDAVDRRLSDEMHSRWTAFVKGKAPNIDGASVMTQ